MLSLEKVLSCEPLCYLIKNDDHCFDLERSKCNDILTEAGDEPPDKLKSLNSNILFLSLIFFEFPHLHQF
jgi:hypothetical protein